MKTASAPICETAERPQKLEIDFAFSSSLRLNWISINMFNRTQTEEQKARRPGNEGMLLCIAS